MKKLSTISLFIFGVVVISIMVAGLVFYQKKKDNQVAGSLVVETVNKLSFSGQTTLSTAEISKHNRTNDCWLLINSKVYDITSYFGSHPGGNSKMLATCGKDATNAYMTQDPYATKSGNRSAHSSNAVNMLNDYYIGDLGQSIGQQKITQTNSIVTSVANNYGEDDDEFDD